MSEDMIQSAGQALALWYPAAGQPALYPEPLPVLAATAPEHRDGEQPVLLRAVCSGISRGTERLVFRGLVPASEQERMRCPFMGGGFEFPVKYGYAMIARMETGPADLVGRLVFCLHPHQDRCVVPLSAVHPLPVGLPPARACLTPNMETALNIVWDARISAGDRVLVIGGGVLGLLVASLVAGMPGAEVTLCDTRPDRATVAGALGARFVTPDALPRDQDAVIHVSGNPAGLQRALDAAGTESRVVEASWFGAHGVELALGEAFHSRRLQLIGSQVGRLPAERQARWSFARRLAMAMRLLVDEKYQALITGTLAFSEAPANLPAIFADDAPGLMTVIAYPGQP